MMGALFRRKEKYGMPEWTFRIFGEVVGTQIELVESHP